MKTPILACILLILLVPSVMAADLYKVRIHNAESAQQLRDTDIPAVVRLQDGYLVLAATHETDRLRKSSLEFELVAEDVEKNHLAVGNSHDRQKSYAYPVVYQDDQVVVYRVPAPFSREVVPDMQLAPVLTDGLRIIYDTPTIYNPLAAANVANLDSLMSLIEQDSLQSYTERLQAFYRRWAGTDSCLAASQWIKSKFESFGYDSVVYDPFTFYSSTYGVRNCRNVVAVKRGTTHPDWTVIVGAHHDGAGSSPAADDNGSGTAATLEIARALADIETDVTFIFITFDGEEWGLYGSWHYANLAAARGDNIVYMLNMDMIAHLTNDTEANALYYGNSVYAQLWADLADSLVGITSYLASYGGGSDHYPFAENGYIVTFAQEREFSTHYHTPSDSTTYMNFEYMKRMVQASLATAYTVNRLPPPVIITSVIDGGDGQSLQINWTSMDPDIVDHLWVFFRPEGGGPLDSTMAPGTATSCIITGLTEATHYEIYALGYTTDGRTAAEYNLAYGTPYSRPLPPANVVALPVRDGIKVTWNDNLELDMSHYRIMRNNQLLPDMVTDTFFIDDDPGLGKNLHNYIVRAVDVDLIQSTLVGVAPVWSKAAGLDAGRILAVNRSHSSPGTYMVDETVTGEFLHEALAGLDYEYLSDTLHADDEFGSTLSLYDMIDYEIVVIGGESGRLDDLGQLASSGGRLDSLAYYLSIGGKVIVFGRWGEIDFETTLPIEAGSPGYGYTSAFGITDRTFVLSESAGSTLYSDCVGAHSQMPGYPELTWDSLAAAAHSAPSYTDVSGIPCMTYPTLNQPGMEILYTYNSSDNGSAAEGQPIAWRNTAPGSEYVFFELPLSFIDRDAAAAAIGKACIDFGFARAATAIDGGEADVWSDPSATTTIYLGNFIGGYSPADIDLSTLTINDTSLSMTTAIISGIPEFAGDVLAVIVNEREFAGLYGEIMCPGHAESFNVGWEYTGEGTAHEITGSVTVHGYISGDANTDGSVNIGDATYLINFIFRGGPEPYPELAGDANADWALGVGDAVYLVNYVFKGGSPPEGCQ
jgi:aminopeptidase YwaD